MYIRRFSQTFEFCRFRKIPLGRSIPFCDTMPVYQPKSWLSRALLAFCVFFYQAIEHPAACHISFGKVLFLHFFCHLTNPWNAANWHNAQLPCVFFVWVAAYVFSAFSRFLRFANKKCPSRRYPCAGWALVCFWCYAFDAGPATRVFTPAPPGIFAASNSAAQTRQWSAG